MKENFYWIWLSKLKNLGYNRLELLLKYFGNIRNIWNATYEELLKLEKIDVSLAKEIVNSKLRENINNIAAYMKMNNVQLLNIYDKKYPKKLKSIYSPPICLYIQGNIKLLYTEMIAIIGCRQCSIYGIRSATKLSYGLAKYNKTIISGMAKGIDSVAHIGALRAKGGTIAVLGSSFDNIYPKENLKLYQNIILNNGAVISEYPPFSKIEKNNFVQRNRIISGLSNGVLVVEARKKSGTMITVDFALEQGKDVFAVPGNIDVPTSEGTNILIKEGAIPVTEAEDIIDI